MIITQEQGVYLFKNFMGLADLDLSSLTLWRRFPRPYTKAWRGDSPGNLKFEREPRRERNQY